MRRSVKLEKDHHHRRKDGIFIQHYDKYNSIKSKFVASLVFTRQFRLVWSLNYILRLATLCMLTAQVNLASRKFYLKIYFINFIVTLTLIL